MSGHVYVDETMARGFAMIAVRLRPNEVVRARQRVRALLLPGQRRLHFVDEKDARRKLIIDVVAELPVTAIVYNAPNAETKQRARRRCLRALVGECAARGDHLLVLERVDSLLGEDKRVIVQTRREHACEDTLRFEHLRAYEECLLWIPDVIAWCWARGGVWRQRVEPLIERVEVV
jgi:hypothetical protein